MSIRINKSNGEIVCREIVVDGQGITDSLLPFETRFVFEYVTTGPWTGTQTTLSPSIVHVKSIIEEPDATSNSITFNKNTSTLTCKKIIEALTIDGTTSIILPNPEEE